MEEGESGARLDKHLSSKLTDLSRTRIKSLILHGYVVKNGQVLTDCSYIVKSADAFDLTVPEVELTELRPMNIPLNIVYEDNDLLIINKQAGLTVHPGAGNYQDTLVNALLYHCRDGLSGIGGVARPGIVHRLDKDTSGLMVVAKNDKAHQNLSKQLEKHDIKRVYWAMCWGVLTPPIGTFDSNIGRSTRNRQKMAVVVEDKGKHAITHYKTLQRFGYVASLVECRLQTGRTHQIRVHFTHEGHSLIGDGTYGGRRANTLKTIDESVKTVIASFTRQALHSKEIEFTHPTTGKKVSFTSELPEDMQNLLNTLKTLQ